MHKKMCIAVNQKSKANCDVIPKKINPYKISIFKTIGKFDVFWCWEWQWSTFYYVYVCPKKYEICLLYQYYDFIGLLFVLFWFHKWIAICMRTEHMKNFNFVKQNKTKPVQLGGYT